MGIVTEPASEGKGAAGGQDRKEPRGRVRLGAPVTLSDRDLPRPG